MIKKILLTVIMTTSLHAGTNQENGDWSFFLQRNNIDEIELTALENDCRSIALCTIRHRRGEISKEEINEILAGYLKAIDSPASRFLLEFLSVIDYTSEE